ncbi:TPA: hypothetical protein ACH3X3_001493 [Trebouxia sp. C0006]
MAASVQLHEVQLKKTEQDLFDILRATTKQAGLKTTLRCAGGWVRDKLLGKDSVDIDVALDDLLGTQFAEHLSTYLQSQGQKAGRIAVVQANPEKSKHLETAKVTINELEVDLVNLRSETYVSDAAHRIPEMTFGTPEQDAFRRDFTFNSMFYNINTTEVEDFTGKGKQDLAAGIVRTPLQPKETFLDDPLRVLRAVRFAARFGFQLESSLQEAAASNEVSIYLNNLTKTTLWAICQAHKTTFYATLWALYNNRYAICQSPPPAKVTMSSSFLGTSWSSSN